MEEEKAIAYYDELNRKGEGAARFKQGLGFSTSKPSSSHSSFLTNFVKASSAPQFEKEAQLHSIQNKLKKKPTDPHRHHSGRSTSRDRGNTSRSRSPNSRRSDRRKRSRSISPPRRRSDSSTSRLLDQKRGGGAKGRKSDSDFSQLIPGYHNMVPAERVKARMKLQLHETAENDSDKGMGSGWERFEFDKDAPLDDEEIEGVEDDAAVVKHIGQSFRFSAVEAKNEEKIRNAHDEAMFGAPTPALAGSTFSDSEAEADNTKKESNEIQVADAGLLSEKVLAKQQGSWRDRVRKA
ncbi:hypothetical protein M5689_017240 [Euphorbia peplus]|nr:hypothetical protein M5689_017240 [Euphorbia peplus]